MLPNFYDLKYFLEVAETLNISRASERLGVSQPSLSTAIKRLEEGLGVSLLVRSKTGVQLSAEGKAFRVHARELLKSWEDLRNSVLKSSETPRGRFVIGAHVSIALYSGPHFMPQLIEKYPALELSFVHNLSRKILEKIISFEIDLGLVINPIKHPDLVLTKLGDDEVSLWAAPKITKDKKSILFFDPELNQSQSVLRDAEKFGLSFSRYVESPSLEWIRACVSEGLGVGVLPGRVASLDPLRPLKKLSEKVPFYKDALYLAYRADHLKSPAAKLIVHEIMSSMRASFK